LRFLNKQVEELNLKQKYHKQMRSIRYLIRGASTQHHSSVFTEKLANLQYAIFQGGLIMDQLRR